MPSKLEIDLHAKKEEERLKRISFGHLNFTPAQTATLKGWGFVNPYLGEEVARTSTEHWIAWQGLPSRHREIPLLVARAGLSQEIDYDSFWSYGFTTVADLEGSTDPAETILDAAYLLETTNGNRKLYNALDALVSLIPPNPNAS